MEVISAILHATLITTVNVEFIIGSLENAFIAVVNIVDWVKRGKISSVDQILTALAISRTAFLFSLITTLFVAFLNPATMTIKQY